MNSNKSSTPFENYKRGNINLIGFLENLPDEKEREFEEEIANFISEPVPVEPNLEASLIKILEENIQKFKIGYNAFYCICTYYRRQKNIFRYGKILKKYQYCFGKNPTYKYLQAMFLMECDTLRDIEEALKLSKEFDNILNNNVGIMHFRAEIIIKAFEYNILNLERDQLELTEAERLLKDTLRMSDYAKFHCTYGRLLMLFKKYKEAQQHIELAIDREISNSNYYPLRVAEYQRYHFKVTSKITFEYGEKMAEWNKEIRDNIDEHNGNMDMLNKEMREKIDKYNDKIESTLNKNLEILGFFAALVSFIIGSVQILAGANFQDAFELILELGGTIMLTLSGFGIILNNHNRTKRAIIVFIMGIATIFLGLGIHKFSLVK